MPHQTPYIGKKLKIGAAWTYLQGWVGAVIRFGTGIVLARLLDPADFGVYFAVAAYTSVLVKQVQFGIPDALLQAEELQKQQWNSAFWLMEAVAFLCAAFVFLAAGWLEDFYDAPGYAEIMKWMCLVFFITPFVSISGSILKRQMKYKMLAIMGLFITPVSVTISVSAALSGAGPYTFVIAAVAGAAFTAVIQTYYAPWKPRLVFSLDALRPLLSYGWRIHVNTTLYFISNKVDNMLVGRLAGMSELGIYNRAFSTARLPLDEVLSRLQQLLFGSYSRIQHDLDHSNILNQKILCGMTSAIYLILLVLIAVGDGFIGLLYGEKWLPAAFLLKILAVGSFASTISRTLGAFADAQGLVGREMPIAVTNLILTIALVIIGSYWGLVGIAVGIAIKDYVLMVRMHRMMLKSHVELYWSRIATAMWPALAATATGAIAGFIAHLLLITTWEQISVVYVTAQATTITVVYSGTWWILAKMVQSNIPLQANREMFEDVVHRLFSTVRLSRG